METLIKVRQFNKWFHNGEQRLHVLKDISLDLYSGDFVSVMGPSGSGKSTLINVLGFLDNAYEGEYLFMGQPVQGLTDRQLSTLRNKQVGFIFQEFNLIANMNVRENVQLPLLYGGESARKALPKVEAALSKVGILDKLQAKPHELSGGQRQRVAIARALIHEPQFIIADEPTGALDTKTSQGIMAILKGLHEEGATIIMVTHDPSLQEYANRHIVIIDGQVQEVAAHESVPLIQNFQKMRTSETTQRGLADETD